MTAVSIIPPYFRAWDASTGAPLAGGKVYTYDTGTTNDRTTWSDEDKGATNSNPVILDAAGKAAIHLDGVYRIDVYDASDVLVWSADPVSSVASDAELDAINTALDARLDAIETDLASRRLYVLADDEDSQTLDLSTFYAIMTQVGVFYYDQADSSSTHDGVTCLVDSQGTRFKRNLAEVNSFIRWRTDPPASPSLGDAFLVKSPATGAFSGKADKIALYTRAGDPIFLNPTISSRFDQYWGGYLTYTDNDEWVRGLGEQPMYKHDLGITVREELNTPPVSPTSQQVWLVGTSPTGAWVGFEGYIAKWISAHDEWEMLAPFEGALIYDRDVTGGNPAERRYTSGAWSALPSGGGTSPVGNGYVVLDNHEIEYDEDTNTVSSAAVASVTVPGTSSNVYLILSCNWTGYGLDDNGSNFTKGSVAIVTTSTAAAMATNNVGGWIGGFIKGGDTITVTANPPGAGQSPKTQTATVLLQLVEVQEEGLEA